jgi:hypothetical protein
MEKGYVSLTHCRFENISDNGIYTSLPCTIVAEFSYFGEKEMLGAGSFINMNGDGSTVRIDFCCFQTPNHKDKKAIISKGYVILGTENCFVHVNESEAVSGKSVVEDLSQCGANNYDCHSYCRHVCPTRAFSRTPYFSETASFWSTGNWSLSRFASKSEDFRVTSEMSDSQGLGFSSDLASSAALKSSEHLSISSLVKNSASFTLTSFFSETAIWTKTNVLRATFRFIDTSVLKGMGGFSEATIFSGTGSFTRANAWNESNFLSERAPNARSALITKSQCPSTSLFPSTLVFSPSSELGRSKDRSDSGTFSMLNAIEGADSKFASGLESIASNVDDGKSVPLSDKKVTKNDSGALGTAFDAKEEESSPSLILPIILFISLLLLTTVFAYLMNIEYEDAGKDLVQLHDTERPS